MDSQISIASRKIYKYSKKLYFQLTNLGFNYRPEEGLTSLKLKIYLYYILNKKQRIKYLKEINFLLRQSKKDYNYSYIFPYPYVFKYKLEDIDVFKDSSDGLFYVIHNGRKLYFKRDIKTEMEAKVSYYCSCIEQDKNSPHKYTSCNFDIQENDVVVDIGSAESSFSLDYVDIAKKIYILEADYSWKEALEKTFEPWKDKVEIINKYVSNIQDTHHVTLDSVVGQSDVNFIKIDVEGAERKIIDGAKDTIHKNKNVKMAICTYHNHNDAFEIKNILKNLGFNCSYTEGYMLFIFKKLRPPYFRKGLLRAIK